MWHGMCLFLLGLLTGFVESRFTNMRMGIAAHLEGVMNGTGVAVIEDTAADPMCSARERKSGGWGHMRRDCAMLTSFVAV